MVWIPAQKAVDCGAKMMRYGALRGRHLLAHRAKLLTACISKWNWLKPESGRSFQELALFSSEAEARRQYRQILPRNSVS